MSLVREGGLCLCSRDFSRRVFICVAAIYNRQVLLSYENYTATINHHYPRRITPT